MAVALDMARCAVADGIGVIACTPHVLPGLYDNEAGGIRSAVRHLQAALDAQGIPLHLTSGGDVHLVPDLVAGLRSGRLPTLGGSRYLLLEPPHHVAPPRFEASVEAVIRAGYVPIITHPERLAWVETHYAAFRRLVGAGAWLQLTAGAVVGDFGRRVRYWADRMLDERLVHVIASDAHHVTRRPPVLGAARDCAAARLGDAEAWHLVSTRPAGVLADADPGTLPSLAAPEPAPVRLGGWLQRMQSERRAS